MPPLPSPPTYADAWIPMASATPTGLRLYVCAACDLQSNQPSPHRCRGETPHPPRVLLDVDDVLADFAGTIHAAATREFGALPPFPWDADVGGALARMVAERAAPAEKAREAEHARRWFEAYVCRPGFCINLPVLPGAREALEWFRSTSAEVLFVTQPFYRSPLWVGERLQWLYDQLGVNPTSVLLGAAKHAIEGDIFVDDRFANVTKWALAHPRGQAFQWGMPAGVDVLGEQGLPPALANVSITHAWITVQAALRKRLPPGEYAAAPPLLGGAE